MAQEVSNLTIPTEEELRDALNNGDVTIEEFQLLLDYFYGATFPDLQIAAGNLPNLDLIGITSISQLDDLESEQLAALGASRGESSGKKKSKVVGYSRVYADQELTGLERSRSVYQFRVAGSNGWRAEGSIGGAYGQAALWRSRSLRWRASKETWLEEVVLGNYDVRWGTGLAFGRRSRLLSQVEDLSYESLRTPDRGGFNGLSILARTKLSEGRFMTWRGLASSQLDARNRLSTLGVMGKAPLSSFEVGFLLGRSTLTQRFGGDGFSQEQFSFSVSSRRAVSSRTFWFNAEVNTQRNSDAQIQQSLFSNARPAVSALATAFNAEWRLDNESGNLRGAFWHYPRAYHNLTGGGRSGILYETIEIESLEFEFRDRRINQTGGLLRSVTALDEKNKIETGLELSGQGRGGATRGDYIVAWHRRFSQHDLKVEAGGRTVSKSVVDIQSRWRIRAQITSRASKSRIRAAIRYLKEVSQNPALGFFARFSQNLRTGGRLELWIDVARYRWWQGGLERMYSYVQYETPLDSDGVVTLLTKLVYRYSETASVSSRVVARLEVRTQW